MSYSGHSLWGGGLTSLQKCSWCILQPQVTGRVQVSVFVATKPSSAETMIMIIGNSISSHFVSTVGQKAFPNPSASAVTMLIPVMIYNQTHLSPIIVWFSLRLLFIWHHSSNFFHHLLSCFLASCLVLFRLWINSVTSFIMVYSHFHFNRFLSPYCFFHWFQLSLVQGWSMEHPERIELTRSAGNC